MEIQFKPVEPAELEQLLTLIQEYYAYDQHPFEPVRIRIALEQLMHHPDWGYVWFICLNQQPVGYVVLTLSYSLEYLGRDAFVDEVYLREAVRGQGIGKMTFQFLEETCRALGVNALHLEVDHSNLRAQAVYRQLGFTEHDRYLMTRWIE